MFRFPSICERYDFIINQPGVYRICMQDFCEREQNMIKNVCIMLCSNQHDIPIFEDNIISSIHRNVFCEVE